MGKAGGQVDGRLMGKAGGEVHRKGWGGVDRRG